MMERSTVSGIRTKRSPALPILSSLLAFSTAAFGGTLIDQTVAVVGKRVLTLREIKADLCVGQLLKGRKPSDSQQPDLASLRQARSEIVRRALIRNYLSTTGLAVSEPKDRVKRLTESVRSSFASQDQLAAFLAQRGISDSTLNDLLSDRAQEEAFVQEQLSLRVQVSDKDARVYYQREKSRRYLDKPFESVEKLARESARREKLDQEFQKWLDEEVHRTEILLLPLPSEDPTSGK
ncbi:MAG: hypothetical protein V1798_10685 [Pseudomonadota bacterium]